MSLQFILGSARSGKTNYIYEKMIRESIEHPEQEFFFIVPDQSTLNAQKELVTRHPAHGTMNIDVVGFFRLAYRIFEELSYVPEQLLEDEGKSMVIRKVMEKHKKELKVFGSSMGKQGFIDELKSFFSEMYQYDIEKKELEQAMDIIQKPGLQAKMDDILLIMDSFENYIGERYLISEQLLDVLAKKMKESKKLRNAIFYLDGFTGFTPIQRKVIRQLMELGKQVNISFTIDAKDVSTPYREYELFAMSKYEKQQLIEIARQTRTIVKPDILCYPDKQGSPELRFMEQNLFRYPYGVFPEQTKDIQIQRAVNPRAESRMVAHQLERLIREENYQYKDIIVLTADLENYQSELERSFQDLKIPYFVDVNRKLQNNPCIETILSALKMIQMDFSYEMVFRYLKSGFSCLSMEDADLLENYVIATGIRGYTKWNRPFKSKAFEEDELQRIEACRQEFIKEIKPLKEGVKKRGSTVLDKLTCLYEFFERLQLEEKMKEQQKIFEERGEIAQAKTSEKIFGQILDLMDQMADILGEEKLSYDDFLSVLESGMEEMTVGVIPPSLDQVLIGDMERTRAEGVKVLFFLGINDGIIPKQSQGGGVVSDDQREILRNQGIMLAPTAKMSAYTEQFYLYLALSKPSEKLYLSYCMMNASGENRQPSYVLERVRKIFPEISLYEDESVPEESFSVEEATDHLVWLLQQDTDDETFQELQTLYFALDDFAPAVSYIDAKFYQNEALPISQELVKKLYGDTLSGSVTRMEKFAGCAFSHFMQYGLRLKERLKHEILPVDMGQVFHKTMELVGKRTDWKFADDVSRDSFVDKIVEEAVSDVQGEILHSTSRNEYLLDRMKRISRRAVWVMETYIQRGEFTPEEYEIAFSEQNHLESMRFTLDDGGKMTFSGVVDRMDSIEDSENKYIKIIDYKSGKMKFDFAKIFHGLQMQLIIYMNAMLELEEKKNNKRILPAGMFYFHLDDPIVEEKDPEEAKVQLLKSMKMSGIVNEDYNLIPQMENPGEEGFLSLPVTATKNGYSKNSSVLNTNQMITLGGIVENKMKELGNSLMKGEVSIRPYEYNGTMPCTYCSFRNICAHESGVDPVNKIDKMSLEEGKYALDKGTTKGY